MKIPYGISDFGQIRSEGFFYADKTPFIPLLESHESGYRCLVFLRPRRFGKSTLVSTLEHYYDIGKKEQFDGLFKGLWIGEHPTAERNRYLVLTFDFSAVATDGGHDALRQSFLDTLAGLTRADVGRAVDEFLAAHPNLAKRPEIGDRHRLLEMLEEHYDGYRFSEDATDRVFNSEQPRPAIRRGRPCFGYAVCFAPLLPRHAHLRASIARQGDLPPGHPQPRDPRAAMGASGLDAQGAGRRGDRLPAP